MAAVHYIYDFRALQLSTAPPHFSTSFQFIQVQLRVCITRNCEESATH